ncbi:MAG: Membrane protein involved in the export of O-antigen and teichoic acid [Bacteroidota bacterium]|jgi:O-antigen/teichoic acid export membrane protein
MRGLTRILGNSLITIVSVLVPGVLGLLSLKPLLHFLGLANFTLLSFFWVYTAHLAFFDFGIARNFGIELPKLSAKEKPVFVYQGLRNGLKFAGLGIVLVVLLLWIGSLYQSQFTILYQFNTVLLLLIWVPLAVIQAIVRGIFEASELFVSAAVFRMYNQMVLFITPWIMAYLGYSDLLQLVGMITLLRGLSMVPAMALIMKQFGHSVKLTQLNNNSAATLNNRWITLSNFSGIVNGSLDRFVLLSVLGAQAIGTYIFAQDFSVRILVLSSSFALVLLPFFSKNQSKVHNQKWVSWGMLLILVTHSSIGLFMWLGRPVLFTDFMDVRWSDRVIAFFLIFLLGITANGIGHILLAAIQSHRELKKPAIWHVLSAVLYAPILYFVVTGFGLTAAAFLWSIRSVIDTVVLYYIWMRCK